MYQETYLPRLRAALWVSIPDASLSSAPTEVAAAEVIVTAEVTSIAEAIVPVPPEPSLIVPDGCMDLIVIDSDVVIAGADSVARIFRASPTPTVGLRFDPGVLPQLLTTSAAELADQVTSLDEVIARGGSGSGSGVGTGTSSAPMVDFRSETETDVETDSKVRRLLRITESLTSHAELDHRPLDLAIRLGTAQDSRQPDIAEVAAEFAYSPRQLRRLSAEWFGYGPKHLSKVLRWQAARALIDAGRTRTAAAAAVGYADAAHLWRDEKSLLGR